MTEAAQVQQPRQAARVARAALGLAAIGLLVSAVVAEREDTLDAVEQLSLATLAGSFALVVVALLSNMMSWRSMLAGLGSPLPVHAAARVFLVAQIGKYLPGSVWPLLAQVELGRDHHVPRLRSAVAGLAALMVGLIVGAAAAVVCLGTTRDSSGTSWMWMLTLLPAVALFVRPALLERLIAIALRVARRTSEPFAMDGGELRRCALWSVVMWLALGGQVFLLALDLGADRDQLLLLSIGAYAAAWVTGLLVVVAPAGAGAREAALVVALAPVLPRGDALALAVVSRLLTVLGDGVCVGGALLARRWHLRAGRKGPADVAGGPDGAK